MPESLVDALGSVPSYYLRSFYAHDEVVAEQRGAPTRGQAVAAMEAELLKIYADPSVTTKPELLSQRGGALRANRAGNRPRAPHALAHLDPRGRLAAVHRRQ